ncbi:MAG TPA: tetratricopeptide repeat protein, partial [Pyrinomonadaceae bacterium]|nr:tetratricopeptide repeat protein [Pyrinomonadaceae bacterium]
MRNIIGASALAAALVFAPFTTAFASPFAPAPTAPRRQQQQQDDTPPEAEQKIFNQGRELFTKGRYEQAATVFSDFLKKYPNSFISDLMLLWLGRSYIELGKLADAEQVGQRLRTIPDTPFADIYESELQNARRVAAADPARATAAVAAAATPTPVPATTVARATPTPAPVRPVATPTPRPAPAEVASSRRNPNTPTLNIRGEGNESRPRTTRERPSRRSTSPAAARTTPAPTPARREAPVLVAEARQPSTPARSNADASSDGGTVSTSPAPDTTQSSGGFSLTVKQVPDLQLALRRAALAAQPGQAIQLPLVVTNTGNKEDQFRVETDLPAEFQPSFSGSGADSGGMPIYVTPTLARNASLEVNLNIRVPDNAPDNQQQRFLVRAASQASSTVLKVADASLTVVAAALAATSDVTQETVMPNETFTQRIIVRNQGSASVRSARADFVFNPDFELVNANPLPLFYSADSRTAVW